ncbi:response regulator transcription factor [Haliscomenobacter hydrossis]|uniref:Two component transcriptional regulator, LuxR family n=1 Tax=Haliscomenobacter hydrossis (strain ATCC 27775 / DSM 1100 / LMG 10767 / O) TaxID=760192 RepID=F4KYX3_HALH1|nr:response regulator transcription factor [Haliscomenobacter hydrossis]AEE52660.1 two component transcriptional regulator, LuxR family [Haliscomenobacter hydrossis DSM 1100]
MKQYTVLLADEQPLVRLALRQLLSQRDHYQVVAEVGNEEELLASLKINKPDLVVIDYSQSESFRPSTIAKIKTVSPQTQVLVISADTRKENIFQVLEMGVTSFLTKTCGTNEILDAAHATLKGDKFFCTRVIDCLLEKSFSKDTQVNCAPTPLSSREIEIVQLSARGLIAKEIADTLNLSTHTVYTHRKNIMKKLQINSSSELVLYAVSKGLVQNEG